MSSSDAMVFTNMRFRPQRAARDGGAGVLVPTVAPAGEKLRTVVEELHRLAALRKNRGLPVSEIAFKHAEQFLYRCLSAADGAVPQVMPVDDGGVLLEWRVNRDTYQLEFCVDGSTEAGAFDEEGNDLELGTVPGSWLATTQIL